LQTRRRAAFFDGSKSSLEKSAEELRSCKVIAF